MNQAIMALVVIGGVLSFVGGVMFLVAAFREGIGWGLAVLFLGPIAQLIFLVQYWSEAKSAFLVQLLGVVMVAGGVWYGPQLLAGMLDGDDAATFRAAIELRPEEQVVYGDYVGKTLDEVTEDLGKPKGELRVSGSVTYFYPGLELVSRDGELVAEQYTRIKE